ncbi:MAG: DUF5662 family protein [Bacillota bacterium]
MNSYLKYFFYILKHKWFVLKVGLKLRKYIWKYGEKNISLFQLLIHDLSKFSPEEFIPYMHKFVIKRMDDSCKESFHQALNHHYNKNKHHAQYWILYENSYLEIPYRYLQEMVIDWIAASISYNGKFPDFDNWEWFDNNFNKFKIYTTSKSEVFKIVESLRKNKNVIL